MPAFSVILLVCTHKSMLQMWGMEAEALSLGTTFFILVFKRLCLPSVKSWTEKPKIRSTTRPSNTTPWQGSKDLVSYSTDTCSAMFIHTLFVIAMKRKQPTYPSAGEQIGKMCYIYTVEYQSVVKNNEIMKCSGKWRELGKIVLNVFLNPEKQKPHVFSYQRLLPPKSPDVRTQHE